MSREELEALTASSSQVLKIQDRDFSGADLTGLKLLGGGGRFGRHLFHNCDFRDCRMDGASFQGSGFHYCEFMGASMAGADFSLVWAQDCDFTDADFTDANVFGMSNRDITTNLPGAWPASLARSRNAEEVAGFDLDDWLGTTPPKSLVKELAVRLLKDWEGTLEQSVLLAEVLAREDGDTRELALTLLGDWEGEVGELVPTARALRQA